MEYSQPNAPDTVESQLFDAVYWYLAFTYQGLLNVDDPRDKRDGIRSLIDSKEYMNNVEQDLLRTLVNMSDHPVMDRNKVTALSQAAIDLANTVEGCAETDEIPSAKYVDENEEILDWARSIIGPQ